MTLVNNDITVTKNDATKVAYLERAEGLLGRFQRVRTGTNVSAEEFVEWVVSLKPEISRSTWRQYKASVVWYLEIKKEFALAEQLKTIGNDGSKDVKQVSIEKRNTSSQKKKWVTENEEELIIQHLIKTSEKSFWARPTLAFFKAIMATGLRPAEWQHSVLIIKSSTQHNFESYPVLKVRNAKQTNGRSHGEFRHLHLVELEESDLLYIRIALQYANPRSPQGWITPNGKAENWHEYYRYLRAHLYRVTSKLFPTAGRRVSIYSCRHQFIANLKKAKYSKDEVAALVGHKTDETATVHYGRAKSGRARKELPKPNMEEAKRVKQIYQGRRPQPQARL